MRTVAVEMKYCPIRWNCWDETEGAWFKIRESSKFNPNEKYRILLPLDIKGGHGFSYRFFLGVFKNSGLNINNFEFPGFEKEYEKFKKEFSNNEYANLTVA